MSYTIHPGDCIESMRTMPDNSVDAVITDPPYGIRFMGKAWDGADIEARHGDRRAAASHAPDAGPNGGHKSIAAEAGKYDLAPEAMRAFQEFSRAWAVEALRVLKPGGHLLSFASPRTYHRMASGIEDAGFEIRDQIMWVFGSGFPKSHNQSGDWHGWGTALKPAHEPIVMARKPLVGTVADNLLVHRAGALHIDACRIEAEVMRPNTGKGALPRRHEGEIREGSPCGQPHALGRWPANLIHDGSDDVLAGFPSNVKGAVSNGKKAGTGFSGDFGSMEQTPGYADTGSAARFFYCAKASRSDRNEGTEALPQRTGGMVSNTSGQHMTRRDGYEPPKAGNFHPTVKPTELMAYLCRLVTPSGGVVLDPFMGSGSTGKAAMRGGFRFIGCEIDPDYLAIARARIEWERAQPSQLGLAL